VKTSTLSVPSFANAQERLNHWRGRFAELTRSFRDFEVMLVGLLETGCGDSPAAPLSSLQPSDSQGLETNE